MELGKPIEIVEVPEPAKIEPVPVAAPEPEKVPVPA